MLAIGLRLTPHISYFRILVRTLILRLLQASQFERDTMFGLVVVASQAISIYQLWNPIACSNQ